MIFNALYNVVMILPPSMAIPFVIRNYHRSPYYKLAFPLVIIQW
ncbi:hypothetical protein S2091_0075 [Solimicrobium silvestre]|uniref:Uncharacterized protein n=1 Tax=Solimicrobium silvestre TaxID=2099400 RepID=A0A2S9H4G5_9BURK|nr:hypothetical protein S2091_0075 [Solimicrobium silvestre]